MKAIKAFLDGLFYYLGILIWMFFFGFFSWFLAVGAIYALGTHNAQLAQALREL